MSLCGWSRNRRYDCRDHLIETHDLLTDEGDQVISLLWKVLSDGCGETNWVNMQNEGIALSLLTQTFSCPVLLIFFFYWNLVTCFTEVVNVGGTHCLTNVLRPLSFTDIVF